MIRFGHSDGVMKCTVVRLITIAALLFTGYFIGSIPGVIVATVAQATGVTFEAIYSGLHVRKIVKNDVRNAPVVRLFTWKEFRIFYVPLIFTALLQFLGNPIGSAALSRMPNAIDSLAIWGVVLNLIFLMRSVGMALNEVVVALLDQVGSYFSLRKFARILTVTISVIAAVIFLTPLSALWFEKVTGLSPALSQMARTALVFFLLVPGMGVYQSWFQGAILHGRKTRAISESVVIYLVLFIAVLAAGVAWGNITGLFVGAAAFGLANAGQTGWLLLRSKKILDQARERDTV
jgi:O-antigen/teichoic acid export membrane protein